MATLFSVRSTESHVETVATFGSARLVRCRNGRHELRGGTRRDIIAAKEWISLFGHEVIVEDPGGSWGADAGVWH